MNAGKRIGLLMWADNLVLVSHSKSAFRIMLVELAWALGGVQDVTP